MDKQGSDAMMDPCDVALSLGEQMRDAQRAYFADKTVANLHAAKTLEQKFDRALAALKGTQLPKQETLL